MKGEKARLDDETSSVIARLTGAAFKRERKRTEELFARLASTITAEILKSEERTGHKLDQIDVSLNLIAQRIARDHREGAG